MEEIIKNISSIIVALGLLFGLITKYYPELFYLERNRKIKELLNLKEVKELLSDDEEVEFKEFINSEIKEGIFAVRTKMITNSKSIGKLKELKDELGLNFTWNNIKNAKRFISLKEKKACISISKTDARAYIITMAISLGIIIYLIYEISQIDKNLAFIYRVILSTIYCLCILFVLIYFRNSLNIIDAHLIKKRLEEVRTKVNQKNH